MGGQVTPLPTLALSRKLSITAALPTSCCVALGRSPHLSLVTYAYLEEMGLYGRIVKDPSGLNPKKIRIAKLFPTLNFLPLGHIVNIIRLLLSFKAPLRTLITKSSVPCVHAPV